MGRENVKNEIKLNENLMRVLYCEADIIKKNIFFLLYI